MSGARRFTSVFSSVGQTKKAARFRGMRVNLCVSVARQGYSGIC